MTSWPSNWFAFILDEDPSFMTALSDPIPTCSSRGLGMCSSVKEGEEAAVKFYNEHVEEVKKHVPKDQLLVFEVKLFRNVISIQEIYL